MTEVPRVDSAASDELAALRVKVKRHAAEITLLSRVLERKNRELDALHFVWCDGGCRSGVHRWQSDKVLVTEYLVKRAERNTKRLRQWYDSVKFKYETYGPEPFDPSHQHASTTSEWHRQYALRAALKTDLVIKEVEEAPAVSECRVIDDDGPVVDVVESSIPGITPQALVVRVGPVFHDGVQSSEPGIWVEYQPEYLASEMQGPVLLTPAAWEQLAAAIDHRLSSRWNTVTRAERFTRAVRAVNRKYKESRAEVNILRRENTRLAAELRDCQAVMQSWRELVGLAEAIVKPSQRSGVPSGSPWARPEEELPPSSP